MLHTHPKIKKAWLKKQSLQGMLTFLLMFLTSVVMAQEKLNDQLVRVSYQSIEGKEERDAYVYLPRGYEDDKKKQWPVIVFLHGDGERGNGKDELDYLLKHGPLYEAWVQKRALPFIIICPQLPLLGRDAVSSSLKNRDIKTFPKRLAEGTPERKKFFDPTNPMVGAVADNSLDFTSAIPPQGWEKREQDVIEVLNNVLSKYRANPKQIYLTGLSYGGVGTWLIASKHPEVFAAINPIVGWAHPDWMDSIAKHKIPVWAFCGGRDPYVLTKYFFTGMNRLESLGHKDIRFTIHQDMGHDAWTRVYAGEDIYNWFLSYSK